MDSPFEKEARELEAELRVYWPVSKLTVPMLAEALRAAAEGAWDEGHSAGKSDEYDHQFRGGNQERNPYIKPNRGER